MAYVRHPAPLAWLAGTLLALFAAPYTDAKAAQDVTLNDIVETKRIDGVSVSPDGHWVAYRVISRSIDANSVTGQWFKVGIDGRHPPIELGRAFTPLQIPLLSVAKPTVSQWAPDSSALFVLGESSSEIQVHRLIPGADEIITHDDADVESFEISTDGAWLDYQTRDPRAAITRAQRAAEADGFHFDRSIITDGLPLTDNFKIGTRVTTVRRVTGSALVESQRGELRTKHLSLSRAAPVLSSDTNEKGHVSRFVRPQDIVGGEARLPLGTSGSTIILRQIQKGDVDGQVGSNDLEADLPDGRHVACNAAFCKGAPNAIPFVTFNGLTNEAVFLAEPDYRSRTTIQAWNPVTGVTRVIRSETGALDDGTPFAGTWGLSGFPCVVGYNG